MARPADPARIAFFDAYALDAGAGIALCDLIARIDRDRFEPSALLPREGPLVERLQAVDCAVEVIEPPPPLGDYERRLCDGGFRNMIGAGIALARYTATVAGWLRRHRVDLLHCNQTRAVFEAGAAGRLADVPVVWNVRIRERLPRPVIRFCDECADLIIPLTKRDFEGLPDEQRLVCRSVVIRNAVDIDRFTASRDGAAARSRLGVEKGRLVLSAGVLVRRKGFDLAIRAMARVVRALPDVTLLIAGDEPASEGGCRSELEALTAELGLGDRVILPGHRPDMPDLLTACDLFVLASRHEGDPAVVLEAMATGRPVIAAIPAAAAVVDEVTGLVVPADDAGALATAIVRLLSEPDRAGRMGEAARWVAKAEHDIDPMVRRYEEAWESLLM